jgi:hypothetical protein
MSYENNGEKWEKVCERGKTPENHYKPKPTFEKSLENDRNHNPTNPHNDRTEQSHQKITNQKKTLTLIHDSICSHISMDKFTENSEFIGVKTWAPTIPEAEDAIDTLNYSDVTIIHVGVNDLKTKNVEDCFKSYERLISATEKKSERVIISLVLPCAHQPLNSKILGFNNLITSTFKPTEKLNINYNGNFSSHGEIISKFFKSDLLHLNQTEGTKLLAGNLKRAVYRSSPKKSYKPDQQEPPRPSSNKHPNWNSQTHFREYGNKYQSNQQGSRRNQISTSEELASNLASAIFSILKQN